MRLMITPKGQTAHVADDGELAGSPHRQVWHVLVALPVGSTIVLTVDKTKTTYHTEDDD